MKTKEKKALKPFVTLEQILAFNSTRPETYTESRIINEICMAWIHLGWAASTQAVADYLDVEQRYLSGAVQIITGIKFPALRIMICHRKALALHAAHPSWDAEQVAHALGYKDRSSLFRTLGRETYDKYFAKFVTSDD